MIITFDAGSRVTSGQDAVDAVDEVAVKPWDGMM
jgi:hypothetical protein